MLDSWWDRVLILSSGSNWKLLSNQNLKGPCLEVEVVEEIMGWLG